MSVQNLFRMKKRSFEGAPVGSSWMSWGSMLAVVVAAGAAFTASEIMLMHSRKIRFFNVRVPNLSDLRTAPVANEAFLDQKTPLAVFTTEWVIFGSMASVTAPSPQGDVLVVERAQWQKELSGRLKSWEFKPTLLPSRVVALAFVEASSQSATAAPSGLGDAQGAKGTGGPLTTEVALQTARELSGLLAEHSAKPGVPERVEPAPVFVSIPWQQTH